MKKAIIITAIVLVLGSSAYLYYNKQVELLQSMAFKIMGLSVDKIGGKETVFDLPMRVTSKSRLQATVDKLNLDLLLNDVKIGEIKNKKSFVLPALGYSMVTVEVTLMPQVVKDNIFDIVSFSLNNRDAKMTLDGDAKIKTFVGNLPIPVYYSTTAKELFG